MTLAIYHIPLFPLNTVLFPGMPLTLHIFEERYKQMVQECRERNRPFGVVLIRHGIEAGGPVAEPHKIGCTAHITQVESLSEGRFNLLAVGGERFQIHSLEYDQPYLSGKVQDFPLATGDSPALPHLVNRLQPQVERYVRKLVQVGAEELVASMPKDPLSFAYLAAIVLQVPARQKQELLEFPEAEGLLENLLGVYRKELALVAKITQSAPPETDLPFSRN